MIRSYLPQSNTGPVATRPCRLIWVRHPQSRKGLSFEPLHKCGVSVLLVVIPKQVQQPMKHKMCYVFMKANPSFGGFPPTGFKAERDIPKFGLVRRVRRVAWGFGL